MRFLFELSVFTVIAAMAFGAVFGVVWALGFPFGLRSAQAAVVGLLAVVFWYPAFANVHIAVAATHGESRRARFLASIRAFGLLLCSAAGGAAFLFSGLSPWQVLPPFILGCLLTWGTLLFER